MRPSSIALLLKHNFAYRLYMDPESRYPKAHRH